MAIKERNILKGYFETGDKPTQSQFADLIDSFKHKNDTLSDQEVVQLANSKIQDNINKFLNINLNC